MNSLTQSYLKVPYDLRPAKQVERRMIVESLHILSEAGFPISSYQYTGLGSIYFVDFILVHKFVGIRDLLSVEIDPSIEKRISFNSPFKCVRLQIDDIRNVIPNLSNDSKHLVWLDFDQVLSRTHLEGLYLAVSGLPAESVVIITVDAEPPSGDTPEEWRDHFESEAGEYLGSCESLMDFRESNLVSVNKGIIERCVKAAVSPRPNAQFLPIYNFLYADGHRMLTLGGMIASRTAARRVLRSPLRSAPYYRQSLSADSYEILVPRLTRKERLHLDSAMPCDLGWHPDDFEIDKSWITAYREIYRFLPSYAEMIL
jgi:Putative O-methyltransferase